MIAAVIVSWMYAAVLLFQYLREKISLSSLLRTLGVMALNVPAGILYVYLLKYLCAQA